jgi:hypothetical protein
MSEKFSKEEVDYSRGHLHSHCGPVFHDDKHFCTHFIPRQGYLGLCEGVAGDIDPRYWCKRFLRATK